MMNLLFYKTERLPEPCLFENSSEVSAYIMGKLKKEDPSQYAAHKGAEAEVIHVDYFPSYMLTQLKVTIMLGNGKKELNTDFHILQMRPYYVYKGMQKSVQKELF